MDTELMLDVGQANELKLAFRRAGYTNADIKKLSEGDMLAKVLFILRGLAEVVMVKHIIDCDADPSLPNGWSVEEHQKGGQLEFDPSKVVLYLTDEQRTNSMLDGNKLREELKSKPVLNANVLDYLLAHPELIPVSNYDWKNHIVPFWGTIYLGTDCLLYVRCLRWQEWEGKRWYDSYIKLSDNFGFSPAAVYEQLAL